MNAFLAECMGVSVADVESRELGTKQVACDEMRAKLEVMPHLDAFLRVCASRRQRFCLDALMNVDEVLYSCEYLAMSALPFFDGAENTLASFLAVYDDLAQMTPRVFGACTTIPGVKMSQIALAAKQVPPTCRDVSEIGARYQFYVLRFAVRNFLGVTSARERCDLFTTMAEFEMVSSAALQPVVARAPKRQRRVKVPCAKCTNYEACDVLGCNVTRESLDKNGAKKTFVCNDVFGHVCKHHSVEIGQKVCKTLKKTQMRNGNTIFHVPMQWCLFTVEIGGETKTVDVTGTAAVTKFCPRAPTASVKIFVVTTPDGIVTSFLRIGHFTHLDDENSTLWPIDVSTVRILREPHVLPKKKQKFTVTTGQGKFECDSTGNLFLAPGLDITANTHLCSTSVCIKTIVEPVSALVDLDEKTYAANTKLRAYTEGRKVFGTFLSAGSTTKEIQVAIVKHD